MDDILKKKSDPMMSVNPPVVSGGHGKEVEPIPVKPASRSEYVTEVLDQPETEKSPELSGYLEKTEKHTDLTKPIIDDYTNQVLLKSIINKDSVVTLPMTEKQVREGLHHKVWESVRWMAEWCFRQFKLLHGRAKYKGEPT